jgi:hypothetical protein
MLPPFSSGSACYLLHAGFFLRLFFGLKKNTICSSGTHLNFNGLQGVIPQKTKFFITTAVRTSYSTQYVTACGSTRKVKMALL